MRRAIRQTLTVWAQCFRPQGPIIEMGARYEPGYQWLGDLRPLFPGQTFTGCDIRPGPGVDRLENAERTSFPDGAAGAVLLCEVLEHLRRPELAVREARRILRPDGLLAVSVPFQYRIHGFPSDYWRFTSAGLYTLLGGFSRVLVCAVGPRLKPAFVFAVATPQATLEFDRASERFQPTLHDALARSRIRGLRSLFVERARDFFGLLLGRAEVGVRFFEPGQPDRYQPASDVSRVDEPR